MLALAVLPLAPAIAASPPSLDEIKAGLKQRRERIQSLYVETVGETSSPMTKEEIEQLPENDSCVVKIFAGQKVEYHYASKGDSRYSRKMGTDTGGGLWDTAWGGNDKCLWIREMRPDPSGNSLPAHVFEQPPSGKPRIRFIYPNPWHALVVGEAMIGPNLAAQWTWQDLFYLGFEGEDKECWTSAAADGTEEVDGARCAVLSGAIEVTFEKDWKGERKTFVRRVKCWLDLQHGMALRKWEEYRMPGMGLIRVVNSQFKYFQPGVWLPQEIELQCCAPAEGSQYPEKYRSKVVLSTRIKVTKCSVNETGDSFFEPLIKPGDQVEKSDLVEKILKDMRVAPMTNPRGGGGNSSAEKSTSDANEAPSAEQDTKEMREGLRVLERFHAAVQFLPSIAWQTSAAAVESVPYIRDKRFGDADAAKLAALPNLTFVNLDDTHITDAGLRPLAGSRKLSGMSFANTAITAKGIAALGSAGFLRDIGMDGNQANGLSDEQIKALGHLRGLTLRGNQVTDATVARFITSSNLEQLSLVDTRVTDDVCRSLAKMPSLKLIAINRARSVHDSGLLRLKGLSHLEQLILGNTGATEKGLDDLRRALPKCKIDVSQSKTAG